MNFKPGLMSGSDTEFLFHFTLLHLKFVNIFLGMDDTQVCSSLVERLWRVIHMCESERLQSVSDALTEIETIVSILLIVDLERYSVVIEILNSAVDLLQRAIVSSDFLTQTQKCQTHCSKGMKGRPLLQIPEDWLEFYADAGFSQKDISSLLGISRRTLNRRFSELGISASCKYANISTSELDAKVRSIIHNFPNIGYRTVCSHLAASGSLVQQKRVQECMRRVDIEGVLQRRMTLKPICRRQYSVRAPKSLWHIDGYHKLIR